MEIAYTAHTETCTLLLDAEGVCRSVLAASSHATAPDGRGSRSTRIPSSAERCVGAQYVATLDLREPGGMTSLPVPGAQLLFARTEANGRITLIRSAPVVRFEATPTRVESGIHARPPSQADTSNGLDPLSVTHADTDDEDLTIPFDAPTIPRGRRSSLPPEVRDSGVVPAAPASMRRTTIPPAPRAPRVQPPSYESMMRPSFDTVPTAPPPPVVPRPTMPMQLRPHAAFAATPDLTPVHVTRLPVRDHAAHVPGTRAMSPPSRDSLPTRPSLVRISTTDASDWDIATRPYTRAAR